MLTFSTALLTVLLFMFLPRSILNIRFFSSSLKIFNQSTSESERLICHLTSSAQHIAYTDATRQVALDVDQLIITPPHRAIDSLWGAMKTLHMRESSWTGRSFTGRRIVEQYAFEVLRAPEDNNLELQPFSDIPFPPVAPIWVTDTKCHNVIGRASSLFIAFDQEEHAGAQVNCSGAAMYDAHGGNAAHNTTVHIWRVDAVGNPIGGVTEYAYLPTSRPWYLVQKGIADAANLAPDGPASIAPRTAWSSIYTFVDDSDVVSCGSTLTRPISYCGDYSCFEGVMAASISLKVAGDVCDRAWLSLKQTLAGQFDYQISQHTSSVFIINHVSKRYPEQQGLLVANSGNGKGNSQSKVLTKAVDADDLVTRISAKALLRTYHTWNATQLQDEPVFLKFAMDGNGGCNPDSEASCLGLSTKSLWLDEDTHWLIVVALPAVAFSKATNIIVERVFVRAQDAEEQTRTEEDERMYLHLVITAFVAVGCVVLGFILGGIFTRSLTRLASRMRRLSACNFSRDAEEFGELVKGKRSRIFEVAKLETEFARLSTGMEVFARFVPEPVVRDLVSGQEGRAMPRVERRNVTIMFSAIRNFSAISEDLAQEDQLQVLTQYLTDMTDVIELYGGVVAEVLGDGLLAYWNSPTTVSGHAAKACEAALMMEMAVAHMNSDFEEQGLPQLMICSGVNTGDVLTGVLGSDRRMKFGCMGDPVNLASRLGGLCKKYDVGVLISGATRAQLQRKFLVRKLDSVIAKGRTGATQIFELMGLTSNQPPTAERLAQARLYEEALQAWQEARFPAVRELLTELLKTRPHDTAAQGLLKRSLRYIGPDGQSIVGISSEELANWTGVIPMDSK